MTLCFQPAVKTRAHLDLLVLVHIILLLKSAIKRTAFQVRGRHFSYWLQYLEGHWNHCALQHCQSRTQFYCGGAPCRTLTAVADRKWYLAGGRRPRPLWRRRCWRPGGALAGHGSLRGRRPRRWVWAAWRAASPHWPTVGGRRRLQGRGSARTGRTGPAGPWPVWEWWAGRPQTGGGGDKRRRSKGR